MVDIYLSYREPPKASFLSIPNSGVEWLSSRPFPWLRYIMFSICGAHGDLFKTLDATDGPADYNTSLADLPAVIYYKPSGKVVVSEIVVRYSPPIPISPGECIFVDHQGLNHQLTSTNPTTGCENFREAVLQRDRTCVITNKFAVDCDAAHLIPKCKGDEYIDRVVQLRSRLYSSPPSISGINDGQNGMLLRKDLHSCLGRGAVAFLKTPNYELDPSDIKRVGLGPVCTAHITLQQFEKPPEGANPPKLAESIRWARSEPSSTAALNAALGYGAHLDVQFRGQPPPCHRPPPLPPLALILDYMYGAAAYNRWKSTRGGVDAIIKDYRNANYAHIPSRPQQNVDHNNFSEPGEPPDDPNNPDWTPHTSKRRGGVIATAMDDLNLVLMSLHGIIPQEAATRREKRMEEEELKAQKASRSKVMEWMRTTAVNGS